MAFVYYSLGGTSVLVPLSATGVEPIEIPLPLDLPLFDMRTRLDGREYDLRFDWNGRERRWYLARLSSSGETIVRGVKVIADFPLLLHVKSHPLCPPGTLIGVDFSDQRGEPPDYVDLGRRVRLLYFPATGARSDVGTFAALSE